VRLILPVFLLDRPVPRFHSSSRRAMREATIAGVRPVWKSEARKHHKPQHKGGHLMTAALLGLG
jgi:hypothetical protein